MQLESPRSDFLYHFQCKQTISKDAKILLVNSCKFFVITLVRKSLHFCPFKGYNTLWCPTAKTKVVSNLHLLTKAQTSATTRQRNGRNALENSCVSGLESGPTPALAQGCTLVTSKHSFTVRFAKNACFWDPSPYQSCHRETQP